MSEDKLELVEGNPKDLRGLFFVYAGISPIQGDHTYLGKYFQSNMTIDELVALGDTSFEMVVSPTEHFTHKSFEERLFADAANFDIVDSGSYVILNDARDGILNGASIYSKEFLRQLEVRINKRPNFKTIRPEQLIPTLSTYFKLFNRAMEETDLELLEKVSFQLIEFFDGYRQRQDINILDEALKIANKELLEACVEKIKAIKEEHYESVPKIQEKIKTISDRYKIIVPS